MLLAILETMWLVARHTQGRVVRVDYKKVDIIVTTPSNRPKDNCKCHHWLKTIVEFAIACRLRIEEHRYEDAVLGTDGK